MYTPTAEATAKRQAQGKLNDQLYIKHGYTSRKDYLEQLADEYGQDLQDVLMLASALGRNEDFDGLVSAVQDMESYNLIY